MKLTVTGRHLVIPEADRSEIRDKVARLDRLLNDSAVSATCAVTRERGEFVCELSVHARGNHMLHGVGRARRLPVAASMAVAKVEQQAHRLTDRWKKRRRSGSAAKAGGSVEKPTRSSEKPARTVDTATPRVIRSRAYAAKPMTVADAALLLADSDRPVVVFRHASSDAVTVLYRRDDGHFGLIEPDR